MHTLMVAATYKNTIAGEIVTVTVMTCMAIYGLFVAYRNFVLHKPTGGE